MSSVRPDPSAAPVEATRRGLLTGGALGAAGAVTLGAAAWSADADAAPAHPVRSAGSDQDRVRARQPAYLGYRRHDYAKPWAKYFTERTSPVQRHVPRALGAPVPTADIPTQDELREEMSTPGYSPVETGWGTAADGSAWTAVLTHMPGVLPHMWDWWFGWHSSEPSRYKLWHPEAHLYAGLAEDRTDQQGLTDKQRYLGNTSYVDEYLPDYRSGYRYYGERAGGILVQIGITFRRPKFEGFDTSAFDGTIVVGRGGGQGQEATTSLLCHQVRATKHGSEMRSRFYNNPMAPRDGVRPEDRAAERALTARGPLPVLPQPQSGSFLLLHCAQEMNHLAGFLPQLYREFRHR